MASVFGWWDWDAETQSLVNRVTRERVVCRGPAVQADLPQTDAWLRFDYVHPDLSFPVLVEQCRAEKQDLEPREDPNKPVWRLDYARSCDLWRRESSSASSHPPYGVWRRTDDCVTDALMCWPQVDAVSSDLAAHLRFDGGWLNAVWNPHMRRREERLVPSSSLDSVEADHNPWLIPLDTLPPSPFVFHDYVPRRNGEENWAIDNPILLEGLEFDDEELRFRPKLPAQVRLNQLQSRTAYMLSADHRRLMYPYHGDTQRKRQSHWSPRFKLLYVDDLVVLPIIGTTLQQSNTGAMWHLGPLDSSDILRLDKEDPAFFLRPHRSGQFIPSRPLWLESRWGIVDGWCSWEGTRARHPNWLPELELLRADDVTMSYGYKGGRWVIRAGVTIRP